MTLELEEMDRQAILLALAKLSLTRPGWHPACLSRIAELLGGRVLYEEFRSQGPDGPAPAPPIVVEQPGAATLAQMVLYAWVGEDELGSRQFGLKQAIVPAGSCIPLVSCLPGKLDRPEIAEQLQAQANVFRKPIRLVRFAFAEVVAELQPQ